MPTQRAAAKPTVMDDFRCNHLLSTNPVNNIPVSCSNSRNDATRIAHTDGMRRHVMVDERSSSNHNIIPYADIANNCRIDSDGNTASNRRTALSFPPILTADSAAFMQINIHAKNRSAADSNVVGVPKVQPPPQRTSGLISNPCRSERCFLGMLNRIFLHPPAWHCRK